MPAGGEVLTDTQFAHDGVSEHADVAFHDVRVLASGSAPWRRAARAVLRGGDRLQGRAAAPLPAPRRFAPAVRVGLPSHRSLSEDFNGLGPTPERVHADVVAAPDFHGPWRSAHGDETIRAVR